MDKFQELPRLHAHEDQPRPGEPRVPAERLREALHDGLADGAPLHEEQASD